MTSRPSPFIFTARLTRLALCVAVLQASACQKAPDEKPAQAPPPAAPAAAAFRVTRVQVGNAIDANKMVTAPGTSFKPNDTIYASVSSEGASPGTSLAARWTFEDGQVVSEATQKIAPTGPAVTEFHVAKPDGWPAGKYKVDITADGKPAGGASYDVAG